VEFYYKAFMFTWQFWRGFLDYLK